MNNINIGLNNTILRKSSFKDEDNIKVIADDLRFDTNTKNTTAVNYNVMLSKGIHIDSGNRDITYFPSPYNFVVYIGNHYRIYDNATGRDIYVEPRIQKKIPDISSINLSKIIIPLYTMINKRSITPLVGTFTNINNYILLNHDNIKIDDSFLISDKFITIVSMSSIKINFILNYDTSTVYSYNYDDTFSFTTAFAYTINNDYNSKKERVLHLLIKELDDNNEHHTSSIISTFKLFPKSLKNKYLYANTHNIKKVFDVQPRKLNKISIILADCNNNEIKINYLDQDVSSTANKCYCINSSRKYSCPCNYILHPYNRYHQMTLFFTFSYYQCVNKSTVLL
jgi:hypothetical protein